MRDDLVQQVADAIGKAILDRVKARDEAFYVTGGTWCVQLHTDQKDDDIPHIARAVLACGLVVPTSDVHDAIGRAEARGMSSAVRELRALTQQEPR